MGKINIGRVVLGGLLAGLVVNVGEYVFNTFLFAEQNAAMLAKLGLADIGAQQIVWLVILTFLFGILLIWVYAGIRPRFGAGIKTAICAGLTLWVLGLLVNAQLVVVGITSVGDTVLPGVWSLFEIPIAAIAGAWLYQESSTA